MRKKGRTLVEDKTVFKRGKSEIPLSSMEIEESRRERECRRLVTEEEREERDCDCVVVIFVAWFVELGCCMGRRAEMDLWWIVGLLSRCQYFGLTRFWCGT
jgi:hypothetical protein